MRRISVWIIVCGFSVIGLGLLLGGVSVPVQAQGGDQEAEYLGSDECSSCHRAISRAHAETNHALALQDVGRDRDKDLILADFDQGDDVRLVQFPGEDTPRPFTAEDIEFTVGAGRYAQRYLYEIDRNEYAVLPAEWDVAAQAWRPLKLAEAWPDPAYDWATRCAGCHTTGLDVERGRWDDDGVQCEACHGPASVHVELARDAGRNPTEEELGQIHAAITLSPDAQICGQCHSQGTDADDIHAYPTTYRPGNTLVQEDGFSLFDDSVAGVWWGSGHGHRNNMQYNEWLASKHAESLETMKASENAQDACLECHSGDYAFVERLQAIVEAGDLEGPPPELPTLASAQFAVTCTTCHSPHTATEAESQVVADTYTLCTNCHQNTELLSPLHHPVVEMFEGRQLVEGVEGIPSAHFAEEDGPRCITCHMPDVPVDSFVLASHRMRPVLPGAAEDSPPDVCSGCHEGLTTTDLQSLVEDTQASVRSRLSIAWTRVGGLAAPEAGGEDAQLYDQLVKALTFVQNDGSQGVHNFAYVDALLDESARMLARLSVPGSNLQATEGPAPTATPSDPQVFVVAGETPLHTGVRPMTIIVLGAIGLVLFIAALLLFRPFRRPTTDQEA
jgi:predicted CXXCH cytochrome family protein